MTYGQVSRLTDWHDGGPRSIMRIVLVTGQRKETGCRRTHRDGETPTPTQVMLQNHTSGDLDEF